jgi:hypothetical protein
MLSYIVIAEAHIVIAEAHTDFKGHIHTIALKAVNMRERHPLEEFPIVRDLIMLVLKQ